MSNFLSHCYMKIKNCHIALRKMKMGTEAEH